MNLPLAVTFTALLALLAGSAPRSEQPASEAQGFPSSGDEFVGPFPSWINAKSTYGVVGDGVADDTATIQRALDQVGASPDRSPVLYFPAGRYRITGTLRISYRIYVSLVGEDPDTTIVTWDGPAGGTMLHVNGLAYSRVTRFTFQGSRKASVAVEQSWDGAQAHFDTGNEYSDDRFVDVEYGIHGGFKDLGFAETSILRARFIRNSKAGVALGNFNALDIWIWYSLFEDCGIGVTNEPRAGNYHVYESVFRRSTTADLMMRNTGGFSARGNYSSGSRAFFISPAINHPATVDIHRNTIVDSIDATTIRLGNHGPSILLDNTIVTRPRAAGPAVSWRSLLGSDVVSVGNTFTVPGALSVNGRLVEFDDRTASRSTLSLTEPAFPAALPNFRRPVFEIPRDANAVTIQRTIDAALQQNGQRPIVHFPFATYLIDRTLTIPPSDLQLVGDGMGTTLRWSGANGGVVVRLSGPSRATLRELQVHGVTAADGVVVENVDQPGSRVSLNAVHLREGEKSNLLLAGLANTDVQMIDVGHGSSNRGVSIQVNGARATIFSGASSGNRLSYEVFGGSRVLVRDIWYEGSAVAGFARIHGQAEFTMQGSRVATTGPQPPAITMRDVNGHVTLLTLTLDDHIAAAGDGTRANLLGLALLREPQSPSYFASTSVPPPHALLLNGRERVATRNPLGPGSRQTQDLGVVDPEFIRTMLKGTRETVAPTLDALPAGASDVRMFRVWITNGLNNLAVVGSTPR